MFAAKTGPACPRTIALEGEIDLCNVADARRLIAGAIDDGAVTVLVDLSAVTYMDAALVNALVAGRGACQRRRGDLWVVRVSMQAERVLRLTGLLESIHADARR